jgi:hypothetical protein
MWTSGSIQTSKLTDKLNELERSGWKVTDVFPHDGRVWYVAHKETTRERCGHCGSPDHVQCDW